MSETKQNQENLENLASYNNLNKAKEELKNKEYKEYKDIGNRIKEIPISELNTAYLPNILKTINTNHYTKDNLNKLKNEIFT